MGLISHLQKAHHAAKLQGIINQRQEKAKILRTKLERLYESVAINNLQRMEIERLRMEYAKKQRELLEIYMQKEIEVIEDLTGKFIEKPQLVDTSGKPIKK